jgi:hypothetical protein
LLDVVLRELVARGIEVGGAVVVEEAAEGVLVGSSVGRPG